MKQYRFGILLLVLFTLPTLSLTAAGQKQPASSAQALVVVSIQPQKYFVDRISGGLLDVMVLVGPGQSPHAFEPTPRQLSALASAQFWFTIGVDFEQALQPKIAAMFPSLTIIDTTQTVRYRQFEANHDDEHSEKPRDQGHSESASNGLDPHIWLGRQPVIAMAGQILAALNSFKPESQAQYLANFEAFVHDVNKTFDSLIPALNPLKGQPVFVFHPAFGYFFDEFGIKQVAVETGGKEPTAKSLSELIARARSDGAKAIFVQAQFPTTAARTVAEAIGGSVEEIDPLAVDWLDNLQRIGQALLKAIE